MEEPFFLNGNIIIKRSSKKKKRKRESKAVRAELGCENKLGLVASWVVLLLAIFEKGYSPKPPTWIGVAPLLTCRCVPLFPAHHLPPRSLPCRRTLQRAAAVVAHAEKSLASRRGVPWGVDLCHHG